MEKKYRFLILFFLAVTLISFAGFYTTYLSKFPRFSEFQNLIHIHFLAFSCWLILIILQPILIRKKKFKLHRTLGKFTYFLAPILVITIILLSKEQFLRLIKVDEISAQMTLFIALLDILSFSTFYLIAMIKAKNTRWHAAFIIGATLIILNPGMSRLLNYFSPGLGMLGAILMPFIVSISIFVIEKIKYKRNILQSPYFLIFLIWTLEIISFMTIPQTDFWKNVTSALANFLM